MEMSTKERKKREKQQRRQDIVEAAERVIASQGFDAATMIEIAEEAELSKGTLYLYFQSKDELYMAICKRGSQLLVDEFAELFSGSYTGIELIQKMGENYLRFVTDHPLYFDAFAYYESLRDIDELEKSNIVQACEENQHKVMNFMVQAIQIGMQDGTIDDTYDLQELAILIWASTRGITQMNMMSETGHYYKMLKEEQVEADRLFENFMQMVGTGIAADKSDDIWND